MKGAKLAVTQEFRERVIAELEARGKTQQWLEQQIGAGKGSLTALLYRDQDTSSLVRPVCDALGIGLPLSLVDTEAHYLGILRQMTPETRELAIKLLEALAKK